jgi:hypothetical protein
MRCGIVGMRIRPLEADQDKMPTFAHVPADIVHWRTPLRAGFEKAPLYRRLALNY